MSSNNNAVIALLEKHFDIAFAAPDGVKKLRELILSLAMQGKLVPQDSSDQPASELLKEIEKKKASLFKEGKIKQSKPLPKIKPEELPYDLPKSWQWVRLGNVGETNIGLTYAPSDISDTGTPVLRSNNIQNGKLDLTDLKRVNKDIKQNVLVQQGDLLICARNGSKALVGKTALITDLPESMAFGAFMAIFRSRINGYLLYFINSPLFRQMIDEVNTMTINQITQNNLKSTIFPLPPLAEQRRIVAKIEELMARCDELEKLRGDRDRKQITVHTAALNRLLIAKQQSNFNTAWQFTTQHFSELYSVKENVTELRKAILQLAVMGKLVPQDPSDQPASDLLKAIEKEKERLVKEGKIKKPKLFPEIAPNEIPFSIHDSWAWCRLQEVTKVITCGIASTPTYHNQGRIFLSAKNIKPYKFMPEKHKFVDEKTYQSIVNNAKPEKGDILMTRVGAGIGESAIIDTDIEFAYYVSLTLIKPFQEFLESQYILHFLNSKHGIKNSISNTTGVGSSQGNLNVNSVRPYVIPIPPLAEQRRIIAKIDQLMAVCDNLEKQIDAANSKQTNLLNAVMTKI